MGLLKRMVGLEGPDPKKRKNGWGQILVYPTIYASSKKFVKDLKKLLPLITKEEVDAVVSKVNGGERPHILVDESTYKKLEVGKIRTPQLSVELGRNADCGCEHFLRGCSCGVFPDTNLKDYLILSPEEPDSCGWRRDGRYCDE